MDYDAIIGAFTPKAPPKPKIALDAEAITGALIEAYKAQIKKLVASVREMSEYARPDKHTIKRRMRTIRELRQRIERIDKDIESIYTLHDKLTKVWVQTNPRVPFEYTPGTYLIAETTPVVIEHKGTDTTETYDLGPYILMVPAFQAYVEDIHWVPIWNPETRDRHPHHYVSGGTANTCLGTFAPYVISCLQEVRPVELLHLSAKFVHIYNQGSPLVPLYDISHARPVLGGSAG